MVKVTEQYLEARRRQVLDAARACFSRQGFHGTTMQDISRQAGLSTGVAYRYFRSKEEIICAIGEESHRRLLPDLAVAVELKETRTAIAALSQLLVELVEDPTAFEDQRLSLEVWAEALHNPLMLERCRDGETAVLGYLTGFVTAAQQRGDVNPALTAGAIARVMLSLVDGLVLQRALRPDLDVGAYVAAARALLQGTFWTGGTA